jgi:tRNA(Ile2) C34 agmatinyltransferase TiaS
MIAALFSNQKFLDLFLRVLVHTGAMCPKCGFGTRATSKRWAKCKRCGERCARLQLPTPGKGANDG